MAAPPQPQWTPAPADRWGPGRVVALVLGVLLLVPALGLLAGGGVLLWADRFGRTDGYVFADEERVSTSLYAVTSERIDLSTDADWMPVSAALGTARVEVTGDAGVFVGIAPVAAGRTYLDGVGVTVIDDLGMEGSAADQQQVPGGAPTAPPTEQDFWVAQASGTGTQQLSWEPEAGNWLLVVMNADGSAGVDVDVRLGATVPALGGLGWGLLAGGLFLLLIAVLVVALAARRRRPRYVPPPPGAGFPPPWTPPAPVDRDTAADGQPGPTRTTPDRPPTG